MPAAAVAIRKNRRKPSAPSAKSPCELDVPQHVLRFWESRFAQVRPVKRAGGRRYYRPDDVDLLRGIRALLYGDGYTIRGVQRILREQGLTFVQNVWRAGAKSPPPELEEDRVGDDGAEPHAATSADEELAVPATAAPRPGRLAHATQPAPPRLNVNTEGRRELTDRARRPYRLSPADRRRARGRLAAAR